MDEVEERGGRIMKDRESRLLLAENSKIIFVLPEQSEQRLKDLKKKEQLKIATRSTSNKLLLKSQEEGHTRGVWVEVCRRGLLTLTLFKTKSLISRPILKQETAVFMPQLSNLFN